VLQSKRHPYPAAADGGRLTGEGDQPGSRGSETLRLRNPTPLSPGDDRGSAGLNPGLETLQPLQLRPQFTIPSQSTGPGSTGSTSADCPAWMVAPHPINPQ